MPKAVTPVDVTPTADSTWNTVDIGSHLEAGDSGSVAGALLRVEQTRTDGTETDVQLRKPGDTYDVTTKNVEDDSQAWAFVGVDSNDQFEAWIESDYTLWLIGYVTDAEGASFASPPDYVASLPGDEAWGTIDISGDTGTDTAVLAFFHFTLNETSGTISWATRQNGQTHQYLKQDLNSHVGWFVVGLDANEVFETYINYPSAGVDFQDFRLVGYLTANGTWLSSPTDHSTDTTGSYQSTDVSADVPATANFAIVQMPSFGASATGGTNYQGEFDGDVRRTGSTTDRSGRVYEPLSPVALVQLDGNQTFEQVVTDTQMDLKLLGYTEAPSGGGGGGANLPVMTPPAIGA